MKYAVVHILCFSLALGVKIVSGQYSPYGNRRSFNSVPAQQKIVGVNNGMPARPHTVFEQGFYSNDVRLLSRNFPLLNLLILPLAEMNHEPRLFKVTRYRLQHEAHESIKACRTAACFSNALKFSSFDILAIGDELAQLTLIDSQFRSIVRLLKKRGDYHLFNEEPDSSFIRKAWEADAHGINYIWKTYIEGSDPLYPKIDAISFDKNDPVFADSINVILNSVRTYKYSNSVFFRIPVRMATEALRLNGRDEAIRYSAQVQHSYFAILQTMRSLKWNSFPYSVILVPGLGPEQPGVKLDPGGAKRCDSAAIRYHAGLAPFIVVSGGHVHPNKTPYCEAVEMKEYLVNKWQIPPVAVIIEPYARHTTTNLRNTNRIIFRDRFPSKKPVLIVSDSAQTAYINGAMKDKVIKELGYVPFDSIKMLSATETVYIPSESSMQVNSMDPLDP